MLCLVPKTLLYCLSARALPHFQRCGVKVIADAMNLQITESSKKLVCIVGMARRETLIFKTGNPAQIQQVNITQQLTQRKPTNEANQEDFDLVKHNWPRCSLLGTLLDDTTTAVI